MTALRSCLSTAQRWATIFALPDWRVDGAAPAREVSTSGGVSAAGVADLGEQPGRAHGARAGQRGEDRGIGVDGELLGDLFVERGDLGPDAGEWR